MNPEIREFLLDDRGAVTVDWVALTAAVVIIGIGIVYAVFGTGDDGVSGLVDSLADELSVSSITGKGDPDDPCNPESIYWEGGC